MYSFKQYLLELFDKPHSYEHDPEMEQEVREHFHNPNGPYKDHKIGAVKVFKMSNNAGHLIHAIRNGYHELHHLDSDGISATNKRVNRPNPKFIGTTMHYANKHILGRNKKLKISAVDDIHSSMKSTIERICKKHGRKFEHGSEMIGKVDTPYTIVHPKSDTLNEHFRQLHKKE